MGYTQGEYHIPQYMIDWVSRQTGNYPRITGLYKSPSPFGSLTSGRLAWVTMIDKPSGGPWLIAIARTNPSSSANELFRLTVDGSVIATSTSYHAPTGNNHFIGLPFGGETKESFGPVFARTSFKLECYPTAFNGYIDFEYMSYTIS